MEITKVLEGKRLMRDQRDAWKRAAVGLFALSLLGNAALYGLQFREDKLHREEIARLQAELLHAEAVRDDALTELGALALSSAREKQAREEQARAYEAVGEWSYLGSFKVTAYCPCADCCGKWADGLTATGIPASPGIVAVDPEIIPLGNTVIIDGQRYLAADTGSAVKGQHIDICMTSHEATVAFGVQMAAVWVVAGPQS